MLKEATGIFNFIGLFLFNVVFGDEDVETTAGAESPEERFETLSEKGEEGEDGEEHKGEEKSEGLKWDGFKVRASWKGEIIEALLQNRDEDGENTGELGTTTEHNMSFLLEILAPTLKKH